MFLIIFLISVFSVLFNGKNALSVWLVTSLLIPSFVRILPVPLSFGLAMTFFLLLYSFIYSENTKKLEIGLKWTLIFSFHYILIRIIFSFLGTFFTCLDILQKSYINCLFLAVISFVVWKISDEKSMNLAYKSVCIVLVFVCLFGIFTYFIRSNPYIEILSKYTAGNVDFVGAAATYASEVRGGLESRISVLTYNPLQYAILIIAFIFIPIYQYLKENNKFYIVVIGLMFVNLFLTGSRGPFISLILACSFFYIKYQDQKGRIIFISGFIVLLVFLLTFPGLDNYASYIKSIIFIFSEKASEAADIHGSSISGRLMQLEGVLSIISGSKSGIRTILFGLGDGYTHYFLEKYGINYDGVGAFEGIILSDLLNFGIIGLICVDIFPWIFVFYCIKTAKGHNYISKRDAYLLYSMLLTQILFSFLVGAVYYLIYFSILFCLMKSMMIDHRKATLLKIFRLTKTNKLYEKV